MSLFCKTPLPPSAYFTVQFQEEGNIHYIINFRNSDERYHIFIYDHETTPIKDDLFTWKNNNNLSQLTEYIYKLIIYNEMYKPEEPIYFTTNLGINKAKVLTAELKSFVLEMLFYIQNLTVNKSAGGPIIKT